MAGEDSTPGGARQLTEQDMASARVLVRRGRDPQATDEKNHKENRLVEEFFESLTTRDLRACLVEFEHAEKLEHRKECAQLLIAYFAWVKARQLGVVPIDLSVRPYMSIEPVDDGREEAPIPSEPCDRRDGQVMEDVDPFIIEFAGIAFARMIGAPFDINVPPLDWPGLPQWQSPNAGFGWVNLAHRPKRNPMFRDIGIVCFIELQRRKGKAPLAAARLACRKFGLELDTIERIVRERWFLVWDTSWRGWDDWTPLPDSDSALQREVDMALEWVARGQREKSS